MSPDDIFAANMWPWPDPLLKRDATGRVVFVNAAFLQLYGGRVENWAGHPVQGWPAPNPQSVPYRFETRIGAGPAEVIYDWVEVTMADGNALAIARDVTVFRKEPLITEPKIEPQMTAPQSPAFDAPPAMAAQAPAFAQIPDTAPEPIQAAPAAEIAPQTAVLAPVFDNNPGVETPVQTDVQAQAPVHAPVETPPALPAETVMAEAPAEPEVHAEPITQDVPAPHMPAPEIQAEQPVERAYERRALPIEDGDSVLGSNWRDAVIAKAVGADIAAATETPEPAPEPVAIETKDETDSGHEGLRILLAEDNAINALLTRTLLEAEGCIVETVEDGQLAVQAMTNNMYDLIFMDMRMPNMDGLEATRKIRAMGPRTADLPIIALTANAFDDDRNACFDSGMNDFMTKPVSAEELTAMVETWTKKKETKDEAAA